jgi:hypothetical protein
MPDRGSRPKGATATDRRSDSFVAGPRLHGIPGVCLGKYCIQQVTAGALARCKSRLQPVMRGLATMVCRVC